MVEVGGVGGFAVRLAVLEKKREGADALPQARQCTGSDLVGRLVGVADILVQ